VYAVRFGYLAAWPLAELGSRMGGRPVDLARLRTEFARVLRTQLHLGRTGNLERSW